MLMLLSNRGATGTMLSYRRPVATGVVQLPNNINSVLVVDKPRGSSALMQIPVLQTVHYKLKKLFFVLG